MDERAKGRDAPRIRTLLMDLYNYYRMDSSTDPIILFEQLCYVLVALQMWQSLPEEPAAAAAVEAVGQYRELVKEFAGTELGRRVRPVSPELENRPELVVRLLRTAREAADCAQQRTVWLGPVLSEFLEELFQSRHTGIVCTPVETARELVALLCPRQWQELRVLDPACGSGAFLIALAERSGSQGWTRWVEATGLERDEHLRRCAVLLLHFHGVSRDFAQVEDGGFPPEVDRDRYDLVFANPPFRSLPLRDQRLEDASLPVPTKDVHQKFVQQALLGLRRNGTCALVVPDSFLKNTLGSARSIREWMLKTFCCEGIIKLPAYTFYPQGVVSASVMILRKPAHREEIDSVNRHIFFFEVEEDGRTNDARRMPSERNDFTALQELWPRRKDLRYAWEEREWERERGEAGPWEYAQVWFGALEEIRRNDFSLLPGQYRPQGPTADETLEDPEELLEKLRAAGEDIMELVRELAEAEYEYRHMDQGGAW